MRRLVTSRLIWICTNCKGSVLGCMDERIKHCQKKIKRKDYELPLISSYIHLQMFYNQQSFFKLKWSFLRTCLTAVPPTKIFKTRNGMVGYVSCNQLPLTQILLKVKDGVRVTGIPGDFLLSYSRQPHKIYNFANNLLQNCLKYTS